METNFQIFRLLCGFVISKNVVIIFEINVRVVVFAEILRMKHSHMKQEIPICRSHVTAGGGKQRFFGRYLPRQKLFLSKMQNRRTLRLVLKTDFRDKSFW